MLVPFLCDVISQWAHNSCFCSQVAHTFEEAIKNNSKFAQHWKRERLKLKIEDIPGEEKEDLAIVEVDELKDLNQETLEQEINALKEGTASKRPDLVIYEFKVS